MCEVKQVLVWTYGMFIVVITHNYWGSQRFLVLSLFQNVGRFVFSRFIVFAMHPDIIYV